MSCGRSITTIVDQAGRRVYDPEYLVTTHAPGGCASLLRSLASIWTLRRPPPGASPGSTRSRIPSPSTRKGDVLSRTIDRHPALASPRGACRCGSDQRSQPAPRVPKKRLRAGASSHWRHGDDAHPAALPWQGTPGVGAGRAGDLRIQREGRDSAPHVRRAHPRRREGLNRPRFSPDGRPHRPSSGARHSFPTPCAGPCAAVLDIGA
jgi:hypothetical protein